MRKSIKHLIIPAITVAILTVSHPAGAEPVPASGGQQEASRQAPSEDGWQPAVTPPAATPRPAEPQPDPQASKLADELSRAGITAFVTTTVSILVAATICVSTGICVGVAF